MRGIRRSGWARNQSKALFSSCTSETLTSKRRNLAEGVVVLVVENVADDGIDDDGKRSRTASSKRLRALPRGTGKPWLPPMMYSPLGGRDGWEWRESGVVVVVVLPSPPSVCVVAASFCLFDEEDEEEDKEAEVAAPAAFS